MESTNKTKFIISIGIQLAIILFIVVYKFTILTGGFSVLLQIEPIDPRDPFRGDYVTFRYSEISNINSQFLSDYRTRNGDNVYVTLRKQGDYWSAFRVSRERPNDNSVYIKGTLVGGGAESDENFNNRSFDSKLHIIYGIEEYFIPEGTGRNFSFWDKKSHAEVMVSDAGEVVLKQIYVDDKPWP